MNTSLRTLAVLSLLIAAGGLPAFADTVKTTTTTTTTYTSYFDDGPIYTGTVVEAELQELSRGDFQQKGGTKPSVISDYYTDYQRELDKPLPNPTLVPYKMRITRDLTLADFQGVGISDSLAQTRYNNYVATAPEIESRYVYVMHPSIGHTAVQ